MTSDNRGRVTFKIRAENTALTAILLSPFALCALVGYFGLVYFENAAAELVPSLMLFFGGAIFGIVCITTMQVFNGIITFAVTSAQKVRQAAERGASDKNETPRP